MPRKQRTLAWQRAEREAGQPVRNLCKLKSPRGRLAPGKRGATLTWKRLIGMVSSHVRVSTILHRGTADAEMGLPEASKKPRVDSIRTNN